MYLSIPSPLKNVNCKNMKMKNTNFVLKNNNLNFYFSAPDPNSGDVFPLLGNLANC